eukprot:NODE_765_length_1355_cov_285.783308_g580_i0.p1 GENE.NODE_765_length_1355_cov_285.783308_g580_i0~~NODE_765_length_1355_cov_285.783308_g580_i0.p1  ORF type:complete len:399 (-),score=119.92 NODE_765_length_1355_cov_285.783308_g580_i0:158-1297(-)
MKQVSTLLARHIRGQARIAIIPGDGIGQDVVPWGQKLMGVVGENSVLSFEFVPLKAGLAAFKESGTSISEDTIKSIKSCNGALFGAAATPSPPPPGYVAPIVGIRQALNLYANVRPVLSVPVDNKAARNNVNMVVVRENTECLYVGKERYLPGTGLGKVAVSERHISEKASLRVARFAFNLARSRRGVGRQPHLTIVHKANILPLTDGLFLECVHAVSKEFPDVPFSAELIDGFMYKVNHNPSQYDVVLAPNSWGNIISNALAPMVGGLGMVASINEGGACAVAEPVHGTPAHLEGTHSANPLAAMRAAAMLVTRLSPGLDVEYYLERAINQTLMNPTCLTPDLGGNATTEVLGGSVLTNFEAFMHMASEPGDEIMRDG